MHTCYRGRDQAAIILLVARKAAERRHKQRDSTPNENHTTTI